MVNFSVKLKNAEIYSKLGSLNLGF